MFLSFSPVHHRQCIAPNFVHSAPHYFSSNEKMYRYKIAAAAEEHYQRQVFLQHRQQQQQQQQMLREQRHMAAFIAQRQLEVKNLQRQERCRQKAHALAICRHRAAVAASHRQKQELVAAFRAQKALAVQQERRRRAALARHQKTVHSSQQGRTQAPVPAHTEEKGLSPFQLLDELLGSFFTSENPDLFDSPQQESEEEKRSEDKKEPQGENESEEDKTIITPESHESRFGVSTSRWALKEIRADGTVVTREGSGAAPWALESKDPKKVEEAEKVKLVSGTDELAGERAAAIKMINEVAKELSSESEEKPVAVEQLVEAKDKTPQRVSQVDKLASAATAKLVLETELPEEVVASGTEGSSGSEGESDSIDFVADL